MALKPNWHSSQTEPYRASLPRGTTFWFSKEVHGETGKRVFLPTGSAADLVCGNFSVPWLGEDDCKRVSRPRKCRV